MPTTYNHAYRDRSGTFAVTNESICCGKEAINSQRDTECYALQKTTKLKNTSCAFGL